MQTNIIIFAGHFTIGEKTTNAQMQSIQVAQENSGDLAILVNDIDFKRKIRFYEIGGKDMVIKHYGSRKKCGNTLPLCDLPEYSSIPKLIDWEFYDMTLTKIKESKLSIDEILRKEIIPLAIKQKAEEYQIDQKRLKIFTERELRNLAGTRLSSSRKNGIKSWIPLAEKAGVLKELKSNISNIPICSSIMLALYEKLSESGYSSLKQFYTKEDEAAIENGRRLCRRLHNYNAKDPRWNIEIENKYF